MKVNAKILHIPPYISTTWDNVRTLTTRDSLLLISMRDGSEIQIPNLIPEIINAVYAAHGEYLEQRQNRQVQGQSQMMFLQGMQPSPGANTENPMVRFDLDGLEGVHMAMQHNPAQANGPDLPMEILSKISAIGKILLPDEMQGLQKPEPHCNCVYCQIARAMTGDTRHPLPTKADEIAALVEEEEVTEADLQFQEWEITSTSDKMYTVTNKLDRHEVYTVYLGEPVGCTCGKTGCEHVLAVLKS